MKNASISTGNKVDDDDDDEPSAESLAEMPEGDVECWVRWNRSPELLAKHRAGLARLSVEMQLSELRQRAGHTQIELAALLETTQTELSRLERRDDHLVSTVRRYVEALGGTLEVVAVLGDQRVSLKGV